MANLKPNRLVVGDGSSLREAFDLTGGLVGSGALVSMMREHCEQPISVLAHHIVSRDLVHIDSEAEVQFPLFQFDPATLHVRQSVRLVIDTLKPVFNDAELVRWFAEPNVWLGGGCPADAIITDPGAVLNAARTDRFVAAGD